MCVFISLFDCDRVELWNYNRFRAVLHAVDSLNVKHELRSKKVKQYLFCVMQIFQSDISRFAT